MFKIREQYALTIGASTHMECSALGGSWNWRKFVENTGEWLKDLETGPLEGFNLFIKDIKGKNLSGIVYMLACVGEGLSCILGVSPGKQNFDQGFSNTGDKSVAKFNGWKMKQDKFRVIE